MESAPAIISNGAIWATTPLFAAAHLWSWHPLWAAGIWTAYGITALFPQGEALLKPLVESPLRYNFNPLRSTLCGRSPGSVTYEAPSLDNKTKTAGLPITLNASTSGQESTTQLKSREKLTSVTTVNATRINRQSALTPIIRWDIASKPVSSSRTLKWVSISSSSAPNRRLTCRETSQVPTSSASSVCLQPSAESSLMKVKYATPAVTGDTAVDSGSGNLRHVTTWKSFDEHKLHGFKIRSWVSHCLVPAFLLWKLLRFLWPEWRWLPSINTPQPMRKRLNLIHKNLRQWTRTWTGHWQNYASALVALRDQIDMWAGDFVWGGQDPYARVAQAVARWTLRTVGVYFLLLSLLGLGPLAGLVAQKELADDQTIIPANDLASKSPTSTYAVFSASTNAISTALNCCWQFKVCAIAAFQTHLRPDGFHDTFPAPSSRTETVCGWILYMVMSFKTLGLVISNTALEITELYSKTVRASPVSPSDIEESILRFVRTSFALFEPVAALLHQALGCLPFISRSSGSICPLWVWQLNSVIFHDLTPIFLAAVITLNAFAFARCLAPRVMPFTRFSTMLPEELETVAYTSGLHLSTWLRLFRSACLMLICTALLTWFLQVSPEQIFENCIFIGSTVVILYCCRDLAGLRWNTMLERLRTAL